MTVSPSSFWANNLYSPPCATTKVTPSSLVTYSFPPAATAEALNPDVPPPRRCWYSFSPVLS
jgi:hypothetical protein